MRSYVADGNFKATHIRQKNDENDIWLTNGEAFMTNTGRYNEHLAQAQETKTVCFISTFIIISLLTCPFRSPPVTVIGPS